MPRIIQHIDRLHGVHPVLVRWVFHVGEILPIVVVEGLREKDRQRKLFASGATKTLDSYHLMQDSGYGHAVDIAPLVRGTIDWENLSQFWLLGGVGMAVAKQLGIPVTWGRDWDNDGDYKDQSFNDFPHWQIPRAFVVPESGFNFGD